MLKLFSLLGALALLLVAVLDLSSATAQNDEQTGRIVARRLDDGRVEFGWQPAGGSRILPTQRYFPADPGHNRWLRSSPVEVGGAEIGRINARQLSDGRIEFAFTPTDGERITPQARYFPTGARVGRWLRSTEIAIGPVAASYSDIAAGGAHTCAIRADSGAIECWGANGFGTGEGYIETGQTDAPDGSYSAVAAGFAHTCAIRASDNEIECWGDNRRGETDAPEGSYRAVSTGSWHTCAIRKYGEIECWGSNSDGQIDAPEWGSYSAVAAGGAHTCAIAETFTENAVIAAGKIECWGSNSDGQTDAPDGIYYSAIAAGEAHTCAISASDGSNGAIECWGSNEGSDVQMSRVPVGQSEPPPGEFRAVAAGFAHTCAIRDTEEIACWGSNIGFNFVEEWNGTVYQSVPPTGEFRVVSAGRSHTCAISASDGAIKCWGVRDHAPPR